MKIWKYTIQVAKNQLLEIPEGGRILDVQAQRDEICLWVLVDPYCSQVTREFSVYGTGHDVPNNELLEHVGTVQTAGGAFVWHIFEKL